MLQAPGSELRRKPVLHRTTVQCRATLGTGKPVPLPYYKKTFGLKSVFMSEGEGEYAMKHILSYMLIIIYIALLPAYVIPRILYNVKQPRGRLE